MIAALLLLALGSSAAFAQFRVVGYVPTWSAIYPANITNIDLHKLTHLNIAFANPDSTGALIPSDHTIAEVSDVAATAHAVGVKVLMSIGGGSASGINYHNLIATNQSAFIQKIVQYAVNNNLDGIDVDIEGNILDGDALTAQQYESFVTRLGTALHAQGKLMSSALATWFGQYVTITAASQFDYINVMSYDATGPWAPQSPGQHSPFSMVLNDFQYWNGTKNVSSSRINIGVPFYGYGFGTHANQGMRYCDIVDTYPGAEDHDQVDTGANGIYYNGIPTIKEKTSFALEHAGGMMIWEVSQDCTDRRSLLSALDSVVVLQHSSNVENIVRNPSLFTVWPNPTSGTVSLSTRLGPGMIGATITVSNMLGETMFSSAPFNVANVNVAVDMTGFHNGAYLFALRTGNSQVVTRIITRQ